MSIVRVFPGAVVRIFLSLEIVGYVCEYSPIGSHLFRLRIFPGGDTSAITGGRDSVPSAYMRNAVECTPEGVPVLYQYPARVPLRGARTLG
jgi:hypothetical protein